VRLSCFIKVLLLLLLPSVLHYPQYKWLSATGPSGLKKGSAKQLTVKWLVFVSEPVQHDVLETVT